MASKASPSPRVLARTLSDSSRQSYFEPGAPRCKQQERELGLPLGPAGSGLLAYAQHFLTGCRNWKNKKITTSNWEQWPLSPRQRAYAAMDAYAGAAVFIKMGLLEKVVHRMVHTF